MRHSPLVAAALLSRLSAAVKHSKDHGYDTSYTSDFGSEGTTTVITPRPSDDSEVYDDAGSYWLPAPIVVDYLTTTYLKPTTIHGKPTKATTTSVSTIWKNKGKTGHFSQHGPPVVNYKWTTSTSTFTETTTPSVKTAWTVHAPASAAVPVYWGPGVDYNENYEPEDEVTTISVLVPHTTETEGSLQTGYEVHWKTFKPTWTLEPGPVDTRLPEYQPRPVELTEIHEVTVTKETTITKTISESHTTMTVIHTYPVEETTTSEDVSTITPAPLLSTPVSPSASNSLESLSAAASHISAADEYVSAGLHNYLEAEWAFWHALEAARTMRLLEDDDATLAYPFAGSTSAVASVFDNISSYSSATIYVVQNGTTSTLSGGVPTVTATTTVTNEPATTSTTTIQSVQTRAVQSRSGCNCANCTCGACDHDTSDKRIVRRPFNDSSIDDIDYYDDDDSVDYSSMAEWIQDLPEELQDLCDDPKVNKLLIFHVGAVALEYSTGTSRIMRREAKALAADSTSTVVETSDATPAYDDGNRVILVDDGKVKVKVNKSSKPSKLLGH